MTAGSPDRMDEDLTARLNVFVPGVMGAGILVSLGALIFDAARKLGPTRPGGRQDQLAARAVATTTVAPAGTEVPSTAQRSRLTYLLVAIGFGGTGGYVLVGSFWNYVNPSPGQNWVEDIAWLWGLSTVAALAFLGIGATAALLALKVRRLPVLAVSMWAATPLASVRTGADPGRGPREVGKESWRQPPRRSRRVRRSAGPDPRTRLSTARTSPTRRRGRRPRR